MNEEDALKLYVLLNKYDVTTFVRDPARLPQELSSKVTVKTGDVLDSKAVDEAVQDQDAVVILLGTRNDLTFNFREKSAVPERFYPILEDHERMLEVLKASDLEWVAVLPPHITESA
ncbi:Flavin reductase (NADPH) [Portunus trituberculatus]|uniref:Flavin reductase (NADPH) n=1 Tax=Portunus trituberculatus TaxID=210409 RepID=A0A5B7H9H3_PORTR|nr:Flavin reductase (NADPH) [Portunus trituberculatus]